MDLRLGDAEFGALTPLLFDALLKRKEAQDMKEDGRAGVIAAAVVNYSMCHPEKVMVAADFFTTLKQGEKKDQNFDLRDLSPEEQIDYVRKQFGKKIFTRK